MARAGQCHGFLLVCCKMLLLRSDKKVTCFGNHALTQYGEKSLTTECLDISASFLHSWHQHKEQMSKCQMHISSALNNDVCGPPHADGGPGGSAKTPQCTTHFADGASCGMVLGRHRSPDSPPGAGIGRLRSSSRPIPHSAHEALQSL